ncbi:Glia-derived nexin [Halotydeus destructor]|nr:Glia-derived nexin [Halotydeus destructor]
MSKLSNCVSLLNQFSFDLLSTVISCSTSKQRENVIISPYSVSQLISIAAAGSRGQTRKELLAVLNQEDDGKLSKDASPEDANCISLQLSKLLLSSCDQCQIVTANRILIRKNKGKSINSDFKECAETNFGASVDDVNFDSKLTVALVNRWVSKHTNGLITTLLQQPPSELSNLLLLNAIYFKGDWLTPFNPDDTSRNKFANYGDKKQLVDTDMMMLKDVHMKCSTVNLGGIDVQLLELPYKGNHSMVILLPEKHDGLFSLTGSTHRIISGKTFSKHLRTMTPKNVNIILPKFKFEKQSSLIEALKRLGASTPFDANLADFTGIRDEGGLFIGDILHKAVVDVNESCTVAAAATAMDVVEGYFPNRKRHSFVADHPFLFVIKHNVTDAIVFLGEVTNF